jgi:hypothetical protein
VLLTASASARELGFLVPPSDATKGRIPLPPRGEFLLPPLGDWKISRPLLRQELRRGLTLSRYIDPDAADITPAGRQPNRSKKETESAPLDAQSQIDSIVLVLFEPLSNRTTEITVRLRSSIESATLAKVTRDYLTNFKRVLEGTSTP